MLGRIRRKLSSIINGSSRPLYITAEIKQTAPHGQLAGKRILITGGTKGLGLSMAKRFLSEGASVIITGRSESSTKAVADQIGCNYIVLDLQNINAIEQTLIDAVEKFGPIDALVNNAGVSMHEPTFFDVTHESFEKQFLTNLEGPFFLTQAFVKLLKSDNMGGNILFVSSETGFTADIRPYGLTKASLNSLVQGLANLLVKDNIRVNAIAPGVVATEMTGFDPSSNLRYQHNSIGRLYLPEEMAELAAFLLSDVSYCVSGQIIGCNNARTINTRWK